MDDMTKAKLEFLVDAVDGIVEHYKLSLKEACEELEISVEKYYKAKRLLREKTPLYGCEEVSFMVSGEKKTGVIEYVDLYAFGIDEVCYDVYVESEECLYKHVRESEILKDGKI